MVFVISSSHCPCQIKWVSVQYAHKEIAPHICTQYMHMTSQKTQICMLRHQEDIKSSQEYVPVLSGDFQQSHDS